jgi:hypothetical protein
VERGLGFCANQRRPISTTEPLRCHSLLPRSRLSRPKVYRPGPRLIGQRSVHSNTSRSITPPDSEFLFSRPTLRSNLRSNYHKLLSFIAARLIFVRDLAPGGTRSSSPAPSGEVPAFLGSPNNPHPFSGSTINTHKTHQIHLWAHVSRCPGYPFNVKIVQTARRGTGKGGSVADRNVSSSPSVI